MGEGGKCGDGDGLTHRVPAGDSSYKASGCSAHGGVPCLKGPPAANQDP